MKDHEKLVDYLVENCRITSENMKRFRGGEEESLFHVRYVEFQDST